MIPATRRSLTSARLDGRSLLSSFTVGSSRDLEHPHRPLSTTSAAHNNPRTRPTKAKSQELAEKVDRKRAVRVSKAVRQDAKTAQARIGRIQKELELQHKRQEGQVRPSARGRAGHATEHRLGVCRRSRRDCRRCLTSS